MGSDEDSGSDSNPSEDNLPPNILSKVLPRKTIFGRKSKAKKAINVSSLLNRKFKAEAKSIEKLNDKQIISIKTRLAQRSEPRNIISNKSLQKITSVVRTSTRTQFSTPKKIVPFKAMTVDAYTQTTTEDMYCIVYHSGREAATFLYEANMGMISEVNDLELIENEYNKSIKKPEISEDNYFKFPVYSPMTNAVSPASISSQYKKGKRIFKNMESHLMTGEPHNKDSISPQYSLIQNIDYKKLIQIKRLIQKEE